MLFEKKKTSISTNKFAGGKPSYRRILLTKRLPLWISSSVNNVNVTLRNLEIDSQIAHPKKHMRIEKCFFSDSRNALGSVDVRICKVETLYEKYPNREFFTGPNTRKYGPEKTSYLDTFYAVKIRSF